MYCTACGLRAPDGSRFCQNCGAALQEPGAVTSNAPAKSKRTEKTRDPYKDQIAQIKLQIKQLKLDLKQITTNMSSTRSQYYETAAFVPRGLIRRGYKMLEDFRLLGPQQQKQQLQNEIMQLEQELLGLQQSQAQWKAQQGTR